MSGEQGGHTERVSVWCPVPGPQRGARWPGGMPGYAWAAGRPIPYGTGSVSRLGHQGASNPLVGCGCSTPEAGSRVTLGDVSGDCVDKHKPTETEDDLTAARQAANRMLKQIDRT